MKKLFLTIGLLISTFSLAQTPASVDIEFLVDASGSMEAKVGIESQMDIAKKSIKQTLATIPPNVPVALRVYAHRVPKSNKEASCQDTELLIPFQPLNIAAFSAAVDTLKPNGYTPIAYSLRAAAQDFADKESQHVIILLSDGEETCGGDPVAEARNLLAQGFKVTIHTIGFRVDPKTKAQLAAISSATGGSYYDASDAASLTQNLAQATQKALLIAKPAEQARGQEIRGGNQYADAIPLQSGIEYRLDHHQRKDQYDYFYIDLKKGDALTVSVSTMDKGISINSANQAQENNNPYAGFRIVDAQYKEWDNEMIIGSRHGKKEKNYVIPQDGRVYILIGSKYDPMHKDSPFQITVKTLADANTASDAPDEITNALPIAVGDYPVNWSTGEHDKDYYKIDAKAGEAYTFIVTPQTMDSRFQIEVYDEDRVRLFENSSQNDGAIVRIENVEPKRDGPLFIMVRGKWNTRPFQYALNIKSGTASTAGGSFIAGPSAQSQPFLPPAATGGVTTPNDQDKTKSSAMLYGILALAGLIILGLIVTIAVLLTKKKTTNSTR